MATTTIPWGDGSGGNIYLTYPSASGDQTVSVSSDANTGAARSKVVTFTSGVGSIVRALTVNQEAGETPGGRVSDYVQNGLVLHLDGKQKGNTADAWTSLVGSAVFTNYGATFNADNVEFDGTDDYLTNSSFTTPTCATGTIEVCFEREGTGTRVAYMPKTNQALSFGCISSVLNWSNNGNRTTYSELPTKGTVGVNNSRAVANGSTMSSYGNTYMSGRSSSTSYIGRRSSGNYFYGKIYSIRIYNRQLTLDEMKANQSVDNIRFNLGLEL